MRASMLCLCISALSITAASPAFGLANRVFVSALSGNNANACDNINTPCQSFAGAVIQLNPNGEVIVLDSGGYGPVTITQGVTIEAPAGVTAFIHPPSGDAIAVNAGSATVTLRGLTLNSGTANGITITSVGTLSVEHCFITGFNNAGIEMLSGGLLVVKETDVKASGFGVRVGTSTGMAQVRVDHCHLDGNINGYYALTTAPGGSIAAASFSTADNNLNSGWAFGNGIANGKNVLTLESCTGVANANSGLTAFDQNAQSVARYSNCMFSDNGLYGVDRPGAATAETRGNNTITGNGTSPTHGGTIGSIPPM